MTDITVEEKKKVYIRPEDIIEFIKELMKKCKTMDELSEHLNQINYCLKHEKFARLREEFGVDP